MTTTKELSGQVAHCERPVVIKSRRFGWSGEHETETVRMVCAVCAADLMLTVSTNVGLP